MNDEYDKYIISFCFFHILFDSSHISRRCAIEWRGRKIWAYSLTHGVNPMNQGNA